MGMQYVPIRRYCVINGVRYFVWSLNVWAGGKTLAKTEKHGVVEIKNTDSVTIL